jgi:hypothetical protein
VNNGGCFSKCLLLSIPETSPPQYLSWHIVLYCAVGVRVFGSISACWEDLPPYRQMDVVGKGISRPWAIRAGLFIAAYSVHFPQCISALVATGQVQAFCMSSTWNVHMKSSHQEHRTFSSTNCHIQHIAQNADPATSSLWHDFHGYILSKFQLWNRLLHCTNREARMTYSFEIPSLDGNVNF